jgi:glycosyltransferase involved in cell wall biosynthesis
MQIQTLLTIAIPTFNRADSLRITLSSILRGLELLSESQKRNVEILVANNASTDQTRAVCRNCKGITYIEQSKNLGYDKNITTIYKNASGTWVLFISDDDIFEHTALPALMNLLERSSHLAVIFCNWYSVSLPGCRGAHAHISALQGKSEFDFSDVCKITPFYFLSSFVLRRAPIQEKSFLIGTYAIQMEIALEVLNKNSRCGVFNQFLVGRTEPTIELVGGNSDSSIAWRIHLGFANVRRKYQNKFGIELSPVAELSSALSSWGYVRNPTRPTMKRLSTLLSSIYHGIANTKITKLLHLPTYVYDNYCGTRK